MTNLIKYTNGNYNVILSLKDGTKIRETEKKTNSFLLDQNQ